MTDFSISQGDTNERRHDDLPGHGRDCSNAADVHRILSEFNFGNLLADLDAFDSGDAEGGDEVDVVPDEEASDIACAGDPELAVAAFSGVSHAGEKKRRKKDDHLKNITEEDFEDGAERVAFRVLKANVDCIFDRKRKPEDHLRAALWVFGTVPGPFDVENCCLVLGARQDVLRLRIHYEFWRRWYVFGIAFPFKIDHVPDIIDGEIYFVGGEAGRALAWAAWSQPGIRSTELISKVAAETKMEGDALREVLRSLSEKYILSQNNDSWYLTGKNPMARAIDLEQTAYRAQQTSLSWSKMF